MGALPIATTAPSNSGAHNDTAAAERVVPHSAASAGTRSSCRWQRTSLRAGSRPAVTPTATIRASQKIGAPAVEGGAVYRYRLGVDQQVGGDVGLPGAVDHSHREPLGRRRDV